MLPCDSTIPYGNHLRHVCDTYDFSTFPQEHWACWASKTALASPTLSLAGHAICGRGVLGRAMIPSVFSLLNQQLRSRLMDKDMVLFHSCSLHTHYIELVHARSWRSFQYHQSTIFPLRASRWSNSVFTLCMFSKGRRRSPPDASGQYQSCVSSTWMPACGTRRGASVGQRSAAKPANG